MKTFFHAITCTAILFALQGCAWLTGLDAESSFKCKAPKGSTCTSLSGVYANYKGGVLTPADNKDAKGTNGSTTYQPMGQGFIVPPTDAPVRMPEKVLRIWMAPYRDTDGDLHDERFAYAIVQPGTWTLDAAVQRAKNGGGKWRAHQLDDPDANANTVPPITIADPASSPKPAEDQSAPTPAQPLILTPPKAQQQITPPEPQ